MATKPENVNPFAKYVEQSAEVATPENPFAKYLTPQEEEPSQILDPAKMFASGVIGPTAAIPLGLESSVRNIPRQIVEQQGITPVEKIGPLTFAEEFVKKGPAQLFTNTAKAFVKKATGESFEKQQERQTQDQIAVDRAISGLPRIPGLSQLADAGEKVSGRLRESVSAAGKQAIADSQAEGNILEAIQNQSLEKLSFGKNPSFMGYALQGSQVLGSLVPIITTAVVTKGSSKAVGTVGFGMGAGEAVQDAQQYVANLSDEQLMQSSPFFKKMVEDGVNPAEARKVVTDKAAEYAAQLQGSVSAFGSVITGKLITGQFDKLMTGPVKNRLGRIALGTTAGAAEEGTQEFLEGIAKDLGINKAVIKEIGEESFANFVLGSLGGAGPGAYRGAVAKTKEEAEAAAKKPTKAEIDAQMRATLGEGAPPPPVVPPAPGVTPPITPASATIEEADVEAIAPAPRIAPTPTPMILQTAGLAPEVAGQVQNLEGQFQMIEQRKLDPNLTEEELKIFNDRQDLIKQEISQLIQSPQAAPQVAPPVDEELLSNIQERGEPVASRMEAEQRLSNGEQIYGFLEQDENRPRLITSVDELAAYTPDQLMALPSAPEIVQSFPMGENSELQVIKNDKGYVTNLYDKDADQYLGTMKLFPTETFGEEAEAKAIEFAKSEADKAAKYEPPATPIKVTKEEQIAINKARMEERFKAAAEAIGNDKKLLEKELKEAKSVLTDKYQERFKNSTFNFEKKQLTSADGKLALQWENDGKTNRGSVRVIPIKEETPIAEESPVAPALTQAEINRQRQAEQKAKAEEAREPTVVELPKKEEAPAIQVTPNKIFTEDAATKARNRLRSKLNRLNSGIDPEFLIDGITLSGYHIEKGARTFAAYAKAMIADLGDKVKPYLKQWYNAVRDDPSAKSLVDDMDTYEQVQKAELPDTTEGAVDLMDPSGKFKIAEDISKHFLDGNGFKDITEARKFITNITGQKIEPGTAQAKEADEAVEVGVVLASRQIAKGDNVYDNLVDLYNRQPNLSVRTSTSISEQAYSTPAPLAYVASQLAGINKNSTVYEPTAGNGMLLIDASPKNVIANELNGTRYEMLERVMDGATINNENAVKLNIAKEFDAIIANPPFGVVKDREGKTISYDVDGFKSNEIDHAIAFKALNNMKDDGRAVLIVGGVMGKTEDGRREGYRSPSKRNFYYNLYQKYNVVDHFTVSGDLYKKQGAAYPVDVIVIAGKGGESIELPAANVPKVYSSYEQLKEKLDEASRMVSKGDVSTTRVDSGESATRDSDQRGVDRGTVRQSEKLGTGERKPTGVSKPSVSEVKPSDGVRPESTRPDSGEGQLGTKDVSQPITTKGPVSSTGAKPRPASRPSTEADESRGLGGTSAISGERLKSRLKDRRGKEEVTEGQVPYDPKSKGNSVGTLVPAKMAIAIKEALDLIESKVGNIDDYVAKELDFTKDELFNDFSAEQIDSLAMSIYNAADGKGFIIGDQTGVGKGRVVAAMIKFALLNDRVPIFVTQNQGLYADMIRDLDAIGMTKELGLDKDETKIFMTNLKDVPYKLVRTINGEKTETELVLKPFSNDLKIQNAKMIELSEKETLDNYKVIFTTYSQLRNQKAQATERQRFIQSFVNDNYLILDESHTAGAEGETKVDIVAEDLIAANTGAFMRLLVNEAYGSFFSSATYAKRPDLMDLYSSTDMQLAVPSIKSLSDAIALGGIPMQQIVANMLAKVGQYIRRERTFAGISYDTVETKVNKETAENMATAMRDILAFSRAVQKKSKAMSGALDVKGAVLANGKKAKTNVESINFGAKMHTLISQMLLSLKAQSSADHAIERLKAGEKVVLTVANTMGSFLDQYKEDMNLETGDTVNLNFSDMYLKYLTKQKQITIRYPAGPNSPARTEVRDMTDEELGPELVKIYDEISSFIKSSGFEGAPISPIDFMLNKLQEAGFKTGEITGRNIGLNYKQLAPNSLPTLQKIVNSNKTRYNAIEGFNNGDIDALILNQAGSTGLSLHASSEFKNQQKRHMILVQAEANVDTHFQMLGRVSRTGQVIPPAYSQMMADIPAEMRPAAVLLKKMASLNANTTASRKSAVTAEGVVDFINEYGGQVANEYLQDNPDIHKALGGEDAFEIAEDLKDLKDPEGQIRKLTGYLPVLPIKQQEEVLKELTDRFNELLEREINMGTNKLEAGAMDLKATTLSETPITKDKGESLFAQPAYMEQVEVNRNVKPMTSDEVKQAALKNLDGKTAEQLAAEQGTSLREKMKVFSANKIAAEIESKADEVRLTQVRGELNLQESKIDAILRTYKIGNFVQITNNLGIPLTGAIIDVKNLGKTKNPAAGSDWIMTFALANGDAKTFSLPFSQIEKTYKLEKVSSTNTFNFETQQFEDVPVIKQFDMGSQVRREKRWMVTGNILAGFAAVDNKGQITNFTDEDGYERQGILMPRTYDFIKEQKEKPVLIDSVDDVMKFLNAFKNAEVATKDKNLEISNKGNVFTFSVAKSKKTGGVYFGDKELIKALGRGFISSGNKMVSTVYNENNARDAFEYLINTRLTPIYATYPIDKAREMFAPKPVLEDLAIATDFKMSDLALKAPNFTIPKGTRLFHGAYLTKAEEIELAGKMLLARQKKKSGGGRMDEGNLVWFGDKDLAKAHSESAVDLMRAMADRESGTIRDPGKVFSTVTDRPYKLMNYNYVLTGKDAAKLNKALGLPDYKSVQKGDSAWQAAYRAHDNGENVPSYEVEGSGRMSAPWPIILETLGYDGYFNESGIAFAAKNAVYLGDEKTPMRVENLTGVTSRDADTRRDEVRAEKIKRSAELSRGISAIKRQIIKGNIGINIQRELTFLEQAKKGINKEIAKTKPARKSAEWVRAKAAAEVAAKNIDNDTYKVIEALATRYPAVLDGLTLSMIKPNVAGVSGNFEPVQRIVTLYKGSATDKTMRHEIAHSMEQMMTPEAQTAVVNAWADALQKAIEDNTDKVSQDYFEAVFDYLQNPTEANYRKATNALPDYKLYQFINPSEYWAVNAEPLLKAQLGGGWQKFKKAMQRLLETIKDILGFDNKRAIHREFARIMSGDQQRITNTMMVEYVTDNADSLKFLNNVNDFDKKFQADGLNHTPVKPSRGIKDLLLGGFRGARQVYRDAKNAPLMASQAMGGKLVRAITYVRNKNIWYGAGLEMADLALQKARGLEGLLRDGEMRAIASIAVTNALHAGHIASEVIIRGALAFNAKTQMFQAIRRPFSMANVLLAKHDLIERVGLQRATDMVNTFFEAKRSKSIMDEFKAREKELQNLNNEMRDPGTSAARQALLLDEILQAEKGLRMINIAKKKVRFDEEQIKFYGNLEKANPELRTMLDNWTKVNDNMIDMMLFSKIIGEKRAKQLKGIKDYVPWYRIQDDMQDLHQASQMGGIKRLTNVGKEKRFEDTVVVQDIDDIVDNMLHNVAMITRNSMRNYAANRVAQEYATRNKKGQIAVFPEEGRTPEGAVRTNILVNGRRIIIEIKDPLIAESVLGMENINMPAMDMLGALANGLRRGVTLWPQFQIRQLFMDAPTAALVTGLKDPTRVWAGTFRGFIKALQSDDPVVDMLKSYGIGGYQSYTRTPEIEYKQQIGLMEKNKFDALMGLLDRVGDASDYGQRVSVYNNTLRQTGDEMLALLQANNVIDFLKRGSARHAQFLTKTVSFMNAYAQQIDILAMSLVGKRLTGKARGAALAQLAKTGATFGFYVMLYSMAVGDDDEYQKLDDQTKVRNIFLSKNWTGLDNNILIPMHTSASFMFKSIPELTYNYITTQGTNNEMDGTRLRTALREAAFDSLLGPNLISTGVKPFAEITLNRNFFTGSTVTPKGMEDLDAVEQYTASTSQLGKVISALTSVPFTENKRVLNPIEADHLVRGLFGTTGSAAQWLSNMFGEDRPSATTRQNPLYGSFVAPDVARGNEDLFYDFKKMVDNKYETYMKLLERDKADEADKYFDKHEALISARDYVTGVEAALRDINRQIRMAGEVKDKTVTPEQRRQEIIDLQRSKQEMLDGIVEMRLEAKL